MAKEWYELTKLTKGVPFVIERVRLTDSDIAVEGGFELPPLARLSSDDQIFVIAFVRSHGSIKQMEKIFGISYPTVKSRLQRIASQFSFFEEYKVALSEKKDEVIEKLKQGEITADEAIRRLSP